MVKQFLQHKSCKSQEELEEAAGIDILKKNGLSGRDLKLVEKYVECNTIVQRPIILARPAINSLIFFMEHIKVISSIRIILTDTGLFSAGLLPGFLFDSFSKEQLDTKVHCGGLDGFSRQ